MDRVLEAALIAVITFILAMCTVWVLLGIRISNENQHVRTACLTVSTREYIGGNCITIKP